MTIDPQTGLITWSANTASGTTLDIQVSVHDPDGLSDTQSFQLSIIRETQPPQNQAPVITSSPVMDASVGQSYQYDVEASDADAGDSLSYSLSTAPTGMSIDASTGVIHWQPTPSQTGSATVTVQVDDQHGGQTQQTFRITVTAQGSAPVITSSPVVNATENSAYQYPVQAIDADGDPITYALLSAPSGMHIDPQSGVISWLADSAYALGNTQPDNLCRLPASSALLRPVATDTVMVIDGSGSNSGSWSWVAQPMAQLNAELKLMGIGAGAEQNYYGVLSFDDNQQPTMINGQFFGTIDDFYERTYDGHPPGSGASENALAGLQFAIDNYPFRNQSDVVKNLIWIADEPQQGTLKNGETLADFTQRLVDGHFNVNVISAFPLYCQDGRHALGFDADGVGYVRTGPGEFEHCSIKTQPFDDKQPGNVSNFALPALASGGGIWDILSIWSAGSSFYDLEVLQKAMVSRLFRTSLVNTAEQALADVTFQGLELHRQGDGSFVLTLQLINRGDTSIQPPLTLRISDAANNTHILATQTLGTIGAKQVQQISIALSSTTLPKVLAIQLETTQGVECFRNSKLITLHYSLAKIMR